MNKILIASKSIENLGLRKVISTMNIENCTTETKIYYNGKIYKKETNYHETKRTNEDNWNGIVEYYTNKGYKIIII